MDGVAYVLEETLSGSSCPEPKSCEDEYSVRIEGLAQ
jgi:hypothetical protein